MRFVNKRFKSNCHYETSTLSTVRVLAHWRDFYLRNGWRFDGMYRWSQTFWGHSLLCRVLIFTHPETGKHDTVYVAVQPW